MQGRERKGWEVPPVVPLPLPDLYAGQSLIFYLSKGQQSQKDMELKREPGWVIFIFMSINVH